MVPCVDRKAGSRSDAPCLAAARSHDLDAQLADWEAMLSDAHQPPMPARDRYMGEAWLQSLQLVEDAREAGFQPVLWVASAGYGLIAADDPIVSYGATFSPPSEDDAGLDPAGNRSAVRRRQWWKALARSRVLETGRPRRLAELPHANNGAPVIVAASSAYVSAFGKDLEELLASESAMLVCASRDLDGSTSDPAFDHRIETVLAQGTRLSLNQRVAGLVVQRLARGGDRVSIAASLRETTARCEAVVLPDRDPASDDEVKHFIRQQLRRDPTFTKSPLLRIFRDQGNQCEQTRFGGLFAEVKTERLEGTLV